MGKKTSTGNWKRAENPAPEPMVVVGFGKYDLADLLGVDYEERLSEAFSKQWPPRYRTASSCTPEEIELFKELTTLMTKAVTE